MSILCTWELTVRKLSCKWPLRITALAFAMPAFYIFHRLGKPDIFSPSELAEKVIVVVAWTMLTWLIYGVGCLFARPLRDTSVERPWKPNKDGHSIAGNNAEVSRDKGIDNSDLNRVLCKGCGKRLPQVQVDYMLGNAKYAEWCRKGYCSVSCFEEKGN